MQFTSQLAIALAFALAFVVITQAADNPGDVCWRPGYGRGIGKMPYFCHNDTEISGDLCYPVCESNYTGLGPVCWEDCPPGFKDIGALCTLPVDIYFDCPWYDICGLTFAKGCRKPCKPGYHNDGCSCRRPTQTHAKKSYGRGFGHFPGCVPPKVEDAGLCYDACKTDFVGEGPMCWGNNTGDATHHIECNLITFGASQQDCDIFNAYIQKSGIISYKCVRALIASIIAGHPVGPTECIDVIKDIYPALKKIPVC